MKLVNSIFRSKRYNMTRTSSKTKRLTKPREIHLQAQLNEISNTDWNDALYLCANLMDDTKQHIHDIQVGRGENKEGIIQLYNLRINYLIKCIRKASRMIKAAYPMDVTIENPKY